MPDKNKSVLSRRSVLDLGAKAAGAVALSSLLEGAPLRPAAERACVCIYLVGGNDSNNMLVPLDAGQAEAYASGRGSLALSPASLLPVRAPATSLNYGFHPALQGIQELYNRGLLAVVANVGRMDEPLTKGQFSAQQLPADLFQHAGASQVSYRPQGRMAIGWDAESTSLSSPTVPVTNNGISLRQQLFGLITRFRNGGTKGTYMATMSGFDSHRDQLDRQASLFTELNDGLTSFCEELERLGLISRVLVYTATEFNRTLAPNANRGTDHAWGGHHLVFGGPVRGGEVFGRFPSLQPGGPDDLGTNGIWIPSISDTQLAATIAQWYGVSNLAAAFPNLSNFPEREVGFL